MATAPDGIVASFLTNAPSFRLTVDSQSACAVERPAAFRITRIFRRQADDHEGNFLYYSIFGMVMPNTFTSNAAGQQAMKIANFFSAYNQKGAAAAAIGRLGTHSLRHTYCSWLDSVGTPVGVQQKLMRHADIRTTMNVYGDAASDEMTEAHSKVVGLALNGAQIAQDELTY